MVADTNEFWKYHNSVGRGNLPWALSVPERTNWVCQWSKSLTLLYWDHFSEWGLQWAILSDEVMSPTGAEKKQACLLLYLLKAGDSQNLAVFRCHANPLCAGPIRVLYIAPIILGGEGNWCKQISTPSYAISNNTFCLWWESLVSSASICS